MDILLDAEDLLRSWREHPAERQELSALLQELTTLGQGAKMADLPQMEALCQVLLRLYAVVEGADSPSASASSMMSSAAMKHWSG